MPCVPRLSAWISRTRSTSQGIGKRAIRGSAALPHVEAERETRSVVDNSETRLNASGDGKGSLRVHGAGGAPVTSGRFVSHGTVLSA